MGKPFRLVDTTFLEKALDASSLRQQVISDNMANANNPDYQAKAVKFDEHLREAFDHDQAKGKKGSFAFQSNLPQHLQIDDIGGWTKENLKPTVETVDGDVVTLEAADMEEGGWAELTVVPDGDYVDNDDFQDVADMLEPGNSAAVLVFEHLWAKNLVSALAGAGGVLLFNARIPASETLD